MNRPTLQELAKRITAHLRRFEANQDINVPHPTSGTRPYYKPWAECPPRGRLVRVTYISYQGARPLTREEATRYLAWLDAGNVGRHPKAFREP